MDLFVRNCEKSLPLIIYYFLWIHHHISNNVLRLFKLSLHHSWDFQFNINNSLDEHVNNLCLVSLIIGINPLNVSLCSSLQFLFLFCWSESLVIKIWGKPSISLSCIWFPLLCGIWLFPDQQQPWLPWFSSLSPFKRSW